MRASLTTISPSRSARCGLGAALNATCPLPCPDAGDSEEIQLAWLDAVHPHSGDVVTVIVPLPPAATMPDPADSVTWHLTGEGSVESVEDD